MLVTKVEAVKPHRVAECRQAAAPPASTFIWRACLVLPCEHNRLSKRRRAIDLLILDTSLPLERPLTLRSGQVAISRLVTEIHRSESVLLPHFTTIWTLPLTFPMLPRLWISRIFVFSSCKKYRTCQSSSAN